MSPADHSEISRLLAENEGAFVDEWVAEISASLSRASFARATTLRQDCADLLHAFAAGARRSPLSDPASSAWEELREVLARTSRSRAQQGFTPSETALLVLSFKKPAFSRLRQRYASSVSELFEQIWVLSDFIDKLALHTTELYQKEREEVIARQQHEMLELSTPVVKLWEGILALPLIGTLDSERTQVVMETLLQRIVETGSEVAIIDITGVPTVDTLVAQHLLKTVAAARLMGVECIISGIRPQIAQTIVHLGVALGDVTTKAGLSDAFAQALRKNGLSIVRAPRA